MTVKQYIDPPSGSKFGFPKEVPQEWIDAKLTGDTICVALGYPIEEVVKYGQSFICSWNVIPVTQEDELNLLAKDKIDIDDLFKLTDLPGNSTLIEINSKYFDSNDAANYLHVSGIYGLLRHLIDHDIMFIPLVNPNENIVTLGYLIEGVDELDEFNQYQGFVDALEEF